MYIASVLALIRENIAEESRQLTETRSETRRATLTGDDEFAFGMIYRSSGYIGTCYTCEQRLHVCVEVLYESVYMRRVVRRWWCLRVSKARSRLVLVSWRGLREGRRNSDSDDEVMEPRLVEDSWRSHRRGMHGLDSIPVPQITNAPKSFCIPVESDQYSFFVHRVTWKKQSISAQFSLMHSWHLQYLRLLFKLFKLTNRNNVCISDDVFYVYSSFRLEMNIFQTEI